MLNVITIAKGGGSCCLLGVFGIEALLFTVGTQVLIHVDAAHLHYCCVYMQ